MPKLIQLTDPELGVIQIRVNTRARHLILRIQPDGNILVTIPPGTTQRQIHSFIDAYRTQVQNGLKKLEPQKHIINNDFTINSPFIHFHVECVNAGTQFQLRSKDHDITLLCPTTTDFQAPGLQDWLHKVIEEVLRKRAKLLLPSRINMWSEKIGLPYNKLKINTSKGRWGSCSARRDINLSCSLMLLPEHLVDYVILHELCHTVEMNHSPRFWKLLDSFTEGKAHDLRAELRNYQTFV